MFVDEAVDWLWKSTKHEDDAVVTAAFEALSKVPCKHFSLRHFPPAITDDINKNSDTDDDSDPEIPGVIYARLLSRIPDRALKGWS
jgi:hypothetical protein